MTHPTLRLAAVRPATIRLVGATLIGFCSVIAAHGQATIGDCEKISAADAYNQCLAKFGPTSKVKSLEPERPGDVKSGSEEAAASAGPAKGAARITRRGRHGRGGRASRHGGGGRKRMTFTIRHRR